MLTNQKNVLLSRLRAPRNILITVIITGLLINLLFFRLRIYPGFQEEKLLKSQYQTLVTLKQKIENVPIPRKATASDIKKLVVQVPLSDEMARFILSLRDLEKKTGVHIQSLSSDQGSSSDITDGLTPIAKGNAPLQTAVPSTPNATAHSDIIQTVPTNTALTENVLALEITGTYAQLIDFIDQIHSLERIANLKQWSMSIHTTDENEIFNLTMSLSIYKRTHSSEFLKDLPALSVESPPLRENPTLSDKEFINLLKESAK